MTLMRFALTQAVRRGTLADLPRRKTDFSVKPIKQSRAQTTLEREVQTNNITLIKREKWELLSVL